MRVIVGEEKCDPRLRVPSGGGRKAWRPRGGAVAGFSRYGGGGGGPLPFFLRAGGELGGKDSGPECLFSCLGGDGSCKMVRGSRGGSLLFPILPGAGGIVLKGVCVIYPGPVTE